jgi:hypothetical protein
MTIDLRKHAPRPEQQPVRVPDVSRMQEVSHGDVRRAHAIPKRKQERAVALFVAGIIALIVLVLLGYGVSKAWGYFFAGEEREIRALVADVGDHMLLPADETPTLATVSDMHALEGQEFFKNAEVGDKVLMYLRSKRAIIYRPSIDRIIEVGPITGAAQ